MLRVPGNPASFDAPTLNPETILLGQECTSANLSCSGLLTCLGVPPLGSFSPPGTLYCHSFLVIAFCFTGVQLLWLFQSEFHVLMHFRVQRRRVPNVARHHSDAPPTRRVVFSTRECLGILYPPIAGLDRWADTIIEKYTHELLTPVHCHSTHKQGLHAAFAQAQHRAHSLTQ